MQKKKKKKKKLRVRENVQNVTDKKEAAICNLTLQTFLSCNTLSFLVFIILKT